VQPADELRRAYLLWLDWSSPQAGKSIEARLHPHPRRSPDNPTGWARDDRIRPIVKRVRRGASGRRDDEWACDARSIAIYGSDELLTPSIARSFLEGRRPAPVTSILLTKRGHACVRLEKEGRTLVIDPGSLTEPQALVDVDVALITHEHPDHVQGEKLAVLAESRPGLEIWTTPGAAEHLEGIRAQVRIVGEGAAFEAAGFEVLVYGKLHAVAWPRVANVGFLVDGRVFHPGDAYTVPETDIDTLLLPTHASWLKATELIDYVREIAPRRAYSVHDGFLNDAGLQLVDGPLSYLAMSEAADIRRLTLGQQIDLH